jgi:hypothetical protein
MLLQNQHHIPVIKICHRFGRANKHIQLHENKYQSTGCEVLTADYEQCCHLGCAAIYSELCHVISQKIVFFKYLYFVDAQFCIPLDPDAFLLQIKIYYWTQKTNIANLTTLQIYCCTIRHKPYGKIFQIRIFDLCGIYILCDQKTFLNHEQFFKKFSKLQFHITKNKSYTEKRGTQVK